MREAAPSILVRNLVAVVRRTRFQDAGSKCAQNLLSPPPRCTASTLGDGVRVHRRPVQIARVFIKRTEAKRGRVLDLRAYDADPMVGVALGRLWDTHPKVAVVLHLLVTVWLGALALWLFATGTTGIGVVLTIGFAVMAGSLVLFTWLAAQNKWQTDDTSYDGRGQVVSPRAAWTNTQERGRILWVLFGIAFLSALVLLLAKSIVGVALILVAFVLAIVAMRID